MVSHFNLVLFGIFILLTIATLIATRFSYKDPTLMARMRSWWVMIIIFSVTLIVGKYGLVTLFVWLSYAAFNEFHHHAMLTSSHAQLAKEQLVRTSAYFAYGLIALQYGFLLLGWIVLYHYFIPCLLVLIMGVRFTFFTSFSPSQAQQLTNFSWDILISIYLLSHVTLFVFYPHSSTLFFNTEIQSSAISLILYLVFLTQSNDIAQYIWGKSFGQRAISPKISPSKTYAGLCGGIVSTMLLSVLIAPWLTPFSLQWAVLSGVLISLSGFVGDMWLSSFKRQFGIKDFSQFIPGHGGVLDRLDSLVVAAPLFFYFFYFVFAKTG